MKIINQNLGEKLLNTIRTYHSHCYRAIKTLPNGNITTEYVEGDLMVCKALREEIGLLEEEISRRNKKLLNKKTKNLNETQMQKLL